MGQWDIHGIFMVYIYIYIHICTNVYNDIYVYIYVYMGICPNYCLMNVYTGLFCGNYGISMGYTKW